MDEATAGGASVPALGLGTYGGDRLDGRECQRVVRTALSLGYRHVDTAQRYGNHRAIGRAIDASPVPREAVFLTTKLWRTNLDRTRMRRSVRETLAELGTGYVDLLLVHWPSDDVPIRETLGAMNALQAEGLVRHVGVSNFSADQLREAMAASRTPIVTNQVEYNPYTEREDLLSVCRERDCLLTAYSPLAKGRVADDDALERIGDRYGKSPTQVALRWLIQQESVVAIPKSTDPRHLRENRDVFDFELTAAEMSRITDLDGGLLYRIRDAL